MTVAQYFDLFIVLWFPLFFLSISVGAGFAFGAAIASACIDNLTRGKKDDEKAKFISVMIKTQEIYQEMSDSLSRIDDSLATMADLATEVLQVDEDEIDDSQTTDSPATPTIFGEATSDVIVSSIYDDIVDEEDGRKS